MMVIALAFDYLFEVWVDEVDRTRFKDCSILYLSVKLFVRRLIFVSDAHLKTTHGASVLPAID
jgi:hypothetical protein